MKPPIVSSIFLTALVLGCAKQAVSPEQAVVRDVIVCARDGRLKDVSRLFHVTKPDAPESEAKLAYVADGMGLIQEQFGNFTSAEPLTSVPDSLCAGVMAEDPEYWRAHPGVTRFYYRTTFSKVGEGFILVEVCHISGSPEIRQFACGVGPQDRAGLEVVHETMSKLGNLLETRYRPSKTVDRGNFEKQRYESGGLTRRLQPI